MDWSAVNAAFSVLAILGGGLVVIATLKKGQHQNLNQALIELQALSAAQQQRMIAMQQQISTLTQELDQATVRIRQLQEDNLMLVRHNRQLEEGRGPPPEDRRRLRDGS